MDFLDLNLESLRCHHHKIADSLDPFVERYNQNPEGDQDEAFRWIQPEGALPNLFYRRESTPIQGLLHQPDPIGEADDLISQVGASQSGVMFCLGFGLGYIPLRFLQKYRETVRGIFVIEKNPQIFLRALCVQDMRSHFSDPTISWFVGEDTSQLQNEIKTFFYKFNVSGNHLSFLPTPSSTHLDQDFYLKSVQTVRTSQEIVLTAVGTSVEDSFCAFENTLINLDEAFAQNGISPLFNQFAGETCISLAAGPSVNSQWDLIKEAARKFPIIACDTLVKPLIENGIVADFITAIEKSSVVSEFFKGFSIDPRSRLISPVLVFKESLESFDGKKILYAPASPYIHYLNLKFLGQISAGGSAGNLNLALAHAMGFKRVIMVGHDLAYGYKTHETHLRGTIDKTREESRSIDQLQHEANGGRVPTQDGTDEVYTRYEWNAFRYHIENLIAKSSDREWYNTSLKGAAIAGARSAELSELIQKFDPSRPVFESRIENLLAEPDPRTIRDRQIKSNEGIREALQAMKTWLQRAENIMNRINGDWSDPRPFVDAITQLKIGALKEDPLFYQSVISILHPEHVVFERSLAHLMDNFSHSVSAQREFVKRHEKYFETWRYWIPQITKLLEQRLSLNDTNITSF